MTSSYTKPRAGRVKLNPNGSYLENKWGAGMILRDSEGSIILSSCRHLFTCADALEAKLLAIKEGISLALQWNYTYPLMSNRIVRRISR